LFSFVFLLLGFIFFKFFGYVFVFSSSMFFLFFLLSLIFVDYKDAGVKKDRQLSLNELREWAAATSRLRGDDEEGIEEGHPDEPIEHAWNYDKVKVFSLYSSQEQEDLQVLWELYIQLGRAQHNLVNRFDPDDPLRDEINQICSKIRVIEQRLTNPLRK
jgi:hypothetical protein